ncbi:MAG: hypothetical protein HY001_02590 [Candidatus Portnoybacteria bacterium]|nr:hypothetical protein [Candidatus Portnoybacteria bacterium]
MIYIVSGEPYQASQFVKKLKEQKIKEGFEYYSFNIEDEGEEIGKRILGLLGTPSLFGRKKFIVLHDYEFTFGKYFLEEFFEKVGTNDILFWTAVKKRVSAAQGEVSISHFEIPKGEGLKTFIAEEFRARGARSDYQMTQRFTRNLYQLPSLYPIINEIEKISLAPAYEKELLTLENGLTPFSLTDALAKRDVSALLRILEKQLQQGEKPFDILSRIIWQLRVLLLVSSSYQLPATSYQLNLHPFIIKKAREALRFFSLQELKNFYLKAISLYGEILFSSLPSDLLLSRFFWQM